MRARFILAEIGIGLRRNLTMTIAVVVTISISLALFGAGLLIGKQVDLMKGYWYDQVEVSLYLCGEASMASAVASCAGGAVTEAERAEIERALTELPQVETVFYESQQQAYERFVEQFEDAAITDQVTPDQLPESFRVKLVNPEEFGVIRSLFEGRPGVENVEDQRELLGPFFGALDRMQTYAFGLALVQLAAAAVLIANTIRVAAYSRRRETGIMRLVGASSFSIQLPFLLEGVITGLVGGAVASGALVLLQQLVIEDQLAPNLTFVRFIELSDVWATVPWVVLTGVAISGAASFVSLMKYLRV
jgi:cell division transport system permease protein